MNKVMLTGNLAADPKMTTFQSGIVKCDFRLAVQRRFANPQTGEHDADFIPIVSWRKLAETCGKHLKKGRKCAIVGAVQTRSYDAADGTKRYVTEIVADEVEFLGSTQKPAEQPAPGENAAMQGFTQIEDDELPF